MTSPASDVNAGVLVLLTKFKNNGFEKRAVTRVTLAVMIATRIGVSNFLAGLFSCPGRGSACVSLRGGVRSLEEGRGRLDEGIIRFCGPVCGDNECKGVK